jgi:acetoin utilization deacetylase AcuC-like enzyme
VIRIRRVYDDVDPRDAAAIREAQAILRARFAVSERVVQGLVHQLRDPLHSRFRTTLFVAQGADGRVTAFALLRHAPDLHFAFLDFISVAEGKGGGGLGGVLYQRVRAEALALGATGLFMECLPDEPELLANAALLDENRARLRFYERYGARPIIGTHYETPLKQGDEAPFLVYDPLGRDEPLQRDAARRIVKAILERRYGDICPPSYIDAVVASFTDDPVRIRPPRYALAAARRAQSPHPPRVPLVVNEAHVIHHIRERGYVEAPVRVPAILREIEPMGLFERMPARHFPDGQVTAVHDAGLIDYLKRVCRLIGDGPSVYPYVFPIRNARRPPKELPIRAGYFCIDTFTPLNGNAYIAARAAVDCALTAAQEVLAGAWMAYALVRPPGHHAERRAFGGFCYLNSTAIAAHYLSEHGSVAILDVDYHHGNGQQEIFWTRGDVLTLSIHGNPRFAYPYFSGFEDEVGEGDGAGRNINQPLPEHVDGAHYRRELGRALRRIREFDPRFLVVALGLDPAKGDPTGTWSLTAADFEQNGRLIGELGLPTLVVQEGGYRTRSLGVNARHFFAGLAGAGAQARRAL